MELTYQKKVGEVVAEDYRAASIFSKYGIDFCCKGNTSIDEACERKNIQTEDVMRELKLLLSTKEQPEADYQSWPATKLADHIEQKHHRYVEETIPVILRNLEKLCHKHGPSHPELYEINTLFTASAGELAQHMKKEEMILFPRIRKIAAMKSDTASMQLAMPGMMEAPIQVMMQEHENEGDRFEKIEALTNTYQPPADACTTYKVTYSLLQEFENDLHLHIHLENNILFPMALEMERSSK